MNQNDGAKKKKRMSFTRIIYNLLLPDKVSFTLKDLGKIMDFIRDLTEGKYVEAIEKHEFRKFDALAKAIDERAELVPALAELLNNKKKGADIKEALMEHRVLIHSLFYNKQHVLDQLSKIIDELEVQVRMQETTNHDGYRVIYGSCGDSQEKR